MNSIKTNLVAIPTPESLGGTLAVSIKTTDGNPIFGHLTVTQFSPCGATTIEDDLSLEFLSSTPRYFDFRVTDATCFGQYSISVNFVSQANQVLSSNKTFNF